MAAKQKRSRCVSKNQHIELSLPDFLIFLYKPENAADKVRKQI